MLANPNITLPSSYQILQEDAVSFYFDFDNQTQNKSVTIAVVRTNPPFGWVGIGFGNTQMKDTDIFIAQLINGQVTVDDYYATENIAPTKDVDLPGGASNWEFLDFNVNATTWVVKARRLIDTGDKYDYVLNQSKSLPVIFAWGGGVLANHGPNQSSLHINFTQGASGFAPVTISAKDVHVWLGLVFWGFIIDAGLFAARYFRGTKGYLIAHAVLAGGAAAATVAAVVEMLAICNFFIGFFFHC